MGWNETIRHGLELYRGAWERQARRSAASLERVGRGRYGPAEALADGRDAWQESVRLWSDLAGLWSRGVSDCLARREGPRASGPSRVETPLRVEVTTLSYGKVAEMARSAEAKVKIKGASGAWVTGRFEAGGNRTDAAPKQLDGKGSATLTAEIDATTSLKFTITGVSADRAGKKPYGLTGSRSAEIPLAHIVDPIVLDYLP